MPEGHYYKARDPDDLAVARLSVSFTKAEKIDVMKRANRAGVSASEYVRSALKNYIESGE